MKLLAVLLFITLVYCKEELRQTSQPLEEENTQIEQSPQLWTDCSAIQEAICNDDSYACKVAHSYIYTTTTPFRILELVILKPAMRVESIIRDSIVWISQKIQ